MKYRFGTYIASDNLTRLQALSERNKFLREGRRARISKTKNGYRVLVTNLERRLDGV